MDDSPVAERDDADAAQLSEASTSAAMEAEAPGSASSDWPASPLDEICVAAHDGSLLDLDTLFPLFPGGLTAPP